MNLMSIRFILDQSWVYISSSLPPLPQSVCSVFSLASALSLPLRFCLLVQSVGRFVPDERGVLHIQSWENTSKVSRPSVSCVYQPWLNSHPKVKLHQRKLSTFSGLEGLAVVFQRAGTLSYSWRNWFIEGAQEVCTEWTDKWSFSALLHVSVEVTSTQSTEPYSLVVGEPQLHTSFEKI